MPTVTYINNKQPPFVQEKPQLCTIEVTLNTPRAAKK
jgi:hypothetical protein